MATGEKVTTTVRALEIAERRIASLERQLAESNERLEMSYAEAPPGFWDWNPETNQVRFDRMWAKVLARNPENVPQNFDSWVLHIHPDDRAKVEDSIQKHLEGRISVYECEYRIVRDDGTIRWIADRGKVWERTADGRPKRVIGSYVDVTERRQEAELRMRDLRRLRSLSLAFGQVTFEHLYPEAYIRWEGVEHLGYTPAEFGSDNDSWLKRIHPDDFEALRKKIDLHIKNREQFFKAEYRFLRKDGTYCWIQDRTIMHYDLDGKVLAAVGVLEDITAQRAYEATLIEARREAESANRLKDQFLANMSHEIRTPMNGIMGILELLQDSPLTEAQQRLVSTAYSSAESLLTIINDILDHSKIEAGKLELKNENFNIRELLDGVRRLFEPVFRQKNLLFTMEVDCGLPDLITCDPVRLRQVIVNLVGNAGKFTPAGGTISLECELSEERQFLRCCVSDSGIGIDESRSALLFQPFVQGDVGVTRQYGGTGLGLAISSRLIGMMGGSIEYRPNPGGGSQFQFTASVTIPEPPIERARALSSSKPEAFYLPPLRVLVAEDNHVNQILIKRMLETQGHAVDLVADGNAAVEMFDPSLHDAVLMDIQMPKLGGEDALREIRARWPNIRTPFVALTANAMKGDREKYLASGMSEYVAKPIKREELLAAIRRALMQTGKQFEKGSFPTKR